MKRYWLVINLLLSTSQFYAADINDIQFHITNEGEQNIQIDEKNYATLYKFLGENIKEFNNGDFDQKYNSVLKSITTIKLNLLDKKKTYKIEEIHSIIDELNKLIEALETSDKLTQHQINTLNRSVYHLTLLANKIV